MAGGKKKNGLNKICKACGKEFYVPKYRINSASFCSLFCQNHKQYERPNFTCSYCKKKFQDSPSRRKKRKFCSATCANSFWIDRKSCQKALRRERIAKIREKRTVGNSGAAIRKFTFSLREKKCQICGYHEHESCLDIHHVDNDPNNNKIDNLMVLCVMCHRKVHRKIIPI